MKAVKVRKRQDVGENTLIRIKAGRNGMVEASYRMDLSEFRVFATMLTMIDPRDEGFCEYEIRVADIIRTFNLNRDGRSYEVLREAAERLVNKTLVLYHTKEGKDFKTVIPFLTSASTPVESSHAEAIRVTFHPDLKPYLLQLRSEYLEIDVRNLAQVQSQYSLRLFMMLRHQLNLGNLRVRYSVDRLREIFQLDPGEYPLYGNFKQRILQRAEADLNRFTNVGIRQMEEERSNRKVVAVIFHLSDQNAGAHSTRRSSPSPVGPAPAEAPAVESPAKESPSTAGSFHDRVRDYVNLPTVEQWLRQHPAEQVGRAIDHTLHRLRQGHAIKNVGGYLAKMVATALPAEAPPPQQSPGRTARNARLDQFHQEQAEREQVRQHQAMSQFERELAAAHALLQSHPEWEPLVIEQMQMGLFGRFYQPILSLDENLANDSMVGPFIEAVRRQDPEAFQQRID